MTEKESLPPAGNVVIACIIGHPKAMALMRTARRRAMDLDAKWRAVFIETPMHMEESSPPRTMRLLKLAEQMGGETQHIEASTIEAGIKQLIDNEKEKISLIIIGDSETKRSLLSASSWRRAAAIARRQHIEVQVVPLSGQAYNRPWIERLRWSQLTHILYALVAVGAACLGATFLEWLLPPALFRVNSQNVLLLFMIACAFAAGRFGLLPGLVASAASVFITNYYYTVPFNVLKFDNLTDMLNMALFLSAAVLISLFTSQTRGFAEKSARRELNTQALFTLYRLATHASSRQQAVEELQQKLTRMLAMDVAFFLPPALNPDGIEVAYPADMELAEGDRKALELCWREMKTTGLASPFYPNLDWRFEPMIAPGGEVGVLGIRPYKKAQLDTWFGRLLTAIADQTASVLEHIELERSNEATRIRDEREKLRSMLLSSVSHDLKTPLASIIGALNIYRSQGKKLSVEKQEMLIETALEEAERLDSFIKNILDMTQIESGRLQFKQDWHNAQHIVQQVIRRMGHRLRSHQIMVHPNPGVEVMTDLMMAEQVLQNVLDNASKYTVKGTLIEVNFGTDNANNFYFSVRDHGTGLPEEKLGHIFDKYARLKKKDHQVAGTGLGLAVSKGMMEMQGGTITAANHPEGGAVFYFTLPKWRKADTAPKYVA